MVQRGSVPPGAQVNTVSVFFYYSFAIINFILGYIVMK